MSRAEDEALYETIHVEHGRVLHAYLLGRTGDREVAADLAQETFVRTWRNVATLRGMAADRRRAWLFAVAYRLVIDHRRSRRNETAWVDRADKTEVEQEVMGRDALSRLNGAICRLPEELRTVLTLSAMEEMTSDEIGRLLRRPAGTVRYQLFEARKRLMREVEP